MAQKTVTSSRSESSYVVATKPMSSTYACFILFYSMISDVILYAAIVPLFGTYLSGACAKTFELSPTSELLFTIILTFAIVYGAFCLFGEVSYWKHLFAFEPLYCNILRIRDGINGVIFIISFVSLASTVESMVADKSMKAQHVSEGTGYFFVKTFFGWLHLDQALLPHFGLQLPHSGSLIDPNFGENERFEHGAAYMFYWAVLSSCVAKLVYFNMLFTYLRSIDIFLSLNPSFDEDDDDDDDRVEEPTCKEITKPMK